MNSLRSYCRVCLTQDGIEEMQPVFENKCKIALEIFLIAQIKITEIEIHARALICRQCHKELLNAINFRKKCQSSDVFFRENYFSFEENTLKEYCENQKIKSEPTAVHLIQSGITDEPVFDEVLKKIDNSSEGNIESYGLNQCKLCSKNFTSLHSLKDHMRAIHQKLEEDDMFRCQYCDKLFKIKYYLSK